MNGLTASAESAQKFVCLNVQYLSVANITVKIIIQCGRAKHMNLDFEFLEKTIKRKNR